MIYMKTNKIVVHLEKRESGEVMKILLTGATGFLGGYIIEELLEHNYQIIAFGRNEEKGKSLEKKGVIFFKGDLRNKNDLFLAAEGVDGIIHAGALSTLWGKWESFYDINVLGTENILQICSEQKIKKMVFISSPSIYSKPQNQLNICEKDSPNENNLNFYIKSKIIAEKKIKEYLKVPTIILRPRGLFGIGDTSIIPRILQLNQKVGVPLFFGGKQKIDITCVENVALASRLALESNNTIIGETFNISNDEPLEFKYILDLFFKELDFQPKYLKLNYNCVKVFVSFLENFYKVFKISKEPPLTKYTLYLLRYSQTLSIEKAKIKLGYQPKITILEGIKKYAENYRKN